MSSALEYWVWLGLAYGAANDRTDAIIRTFGGPEPFYHTWRSQNQLRLTERDRQRLDTTKLDAAKCIIDQTLHAGMHILTPDDPLYPERLHHIYARPCVLYVDGTWEDMDEQLPIAMVGTRRCTEYGRLAAQKIADELARAGVVIVSGLAAGIDTVCHTAAVRNHSRTIAVLGCGINITFPTQNQQLREAIVQNGAIISEYAPGVRPLAAHFPQRNRIIAGLSVGAIVVEAGTRSGSLITANLALEQGRDVFTVPGDIFSKSSEGTFQLLRQGCKPVCCALDVLEEYQYQFSETIKAMQVNPKEAPCRPAAKTTTAPSVEPPTKPAQMPVPRGSRPTLEASLPEEAPLPPAGLSAPARAVWDALGVHTLQIEELALQLQKPAQEVLTALTELEIMGLAVAQAGHRYRRA